MKNGTLLNILGYIILLVCSTSCSGDDALVNDGSHNTTDVAVTSNPTKVGVSFATIDGYVNLNLITANYSKQEIGVEFSMNEDLKFSGRATTKELTGNKLTVHVDTLTANTKYYYRTYVKLNDIVYNGEIRSFNTKDFNNVTSTSDATNLTFTSVTLNGIANIGSVDEEENFTIGFAYSKIKSKLVPDSIQYTSRRECPINNVKDKLYSINLTDLQNSTTYYYCSYMKMGKKYKTGQIKSFSTRDIDSGLITGEATDITLTSATLNGISEIVNLYPLNYTIRQGFLYSSNEDDLINGNNYWSGIKTIDAVVKGNVLTAEIKELQPNSTYYYCVYATIDNTTLKGQVKMFTTSSTDNVLITKPATEITFNSATLNGTTNLSNVYKNGTKQISYNFRYSTNKNSLTQESYYSSNYASVSPSQNGNSLVASINNLKDNTTYYYCVEANIDGTHLVGEIMSFTTHAIDSSIEKLDATNITLNSAKLTATVNKNCGDDTHFAFHISKDNSNVTSSSNRINATFKVENNKIQIQTDIDHLQDNTTYYYCLAMTMKTGQTIYSQLKSFSTYRKTDYLKTEDATDVTTTTAVVNGKGNLESLYQSSITYYIYYSKYQNMTSILTKQCVKAGNNLQAEISDLSKETTYYYCIAAIIDRLEIRGEVKSFITKGDADYFSTGDAGNITLTTAKIHAISSLSSLYPADAISYRVQYSTNKENVKTANSITAPLDKIKLETTLTGLAINTTYFYCCFANAGGAEFYGDIKSFKTLSAEGAIETGNASNITFTTADIAGSTTLPALTSNPNAIEYFIKYSTDQNMKTSNSIPAKIEGNQLFASLSGLSLNTTYYYCCMAKVEGSEIIGRIKNFKTLKAEGGIQTNDASDITLTTAKINGTTSFSFELSQTLKFAIKYSPNQNFSNAKTATATLNNNSLSAVITNLLINQTYYYYCFTELNGIEYSGEVKSFKTLAGTDHILAGEASDITVNSATINGSSTITSIYKGNSTIKYSVNYSRKKDFSLPGTASVSVNGNSLSAKLYGLSSYTTYYYRFVAIIEEQTIVSDTREFQTKEVELPLGFIDLGLPSGTKWASQNIGAENPSSRGTYYAWGETTTKSNFNESNYKHSNKDLSSSIAGTDYDAAFMAGKGRIPTAADFEELITYCTWRESTYNGVVGYFIEGKNGNHIFLPSAGRKETSAVYLGSCMYWTSNNGSPKKAKCLKDKTITEYERYFGLPIRSVQ